MVTTAEGSYDHDYYPAGAASAPGSLSRVTSPSGTTLNFAYDGPLLTSTTWSGTVVGNVAYGYDTDFRLITETVNSGAGPVLHFGYDVDSLLTCVSPTTCSPSGADSLRITYDPQVARATHVFQGETTEARTYNEYGELASLTGTHGSTTRYVEVMDSTTAPRDKLGRVVTRLETLPSGTTSWQYQYDAQGRLEDVQRDGALYEHFTYDANGNRLTREDEDGVVVSADYDAQDRLERYGEWHYTYNGNGQLKTKTHGPTSAVTTYSYDVRGNLLKVVLPNADVIEYVVDGLDRRVAKKKNGVIVRRWLYSGQLHPVAELDASGAVQSRFIFASRSNVPDLIVRDGVTYRVFADHLGSPRVIVSTAASTVAAQVMEHDAFGNVLSDSNPGWQPFGFAGGLWDADTGLVRFGARDYDPVTGRWTAKDPISFAGGQSNLYAYVANDPVNLFDPSGLAIPMPSMPLPGTGAGESAAMFWADAYNASSGLASVPYAIMGATASLWTPRTAHLTGQVLTQALMGVLNPKTAQRAVQRGQGPRDIGRIDRPESSVPGSQWHAHQAKEVCGKNPALNLDGTPHDGTPSFSRATLEWLRAHGWNI